MAASKEAILHALENSLFEFPALPGRREVLDFPGVRAYATPQTSHPMGNLVGVATLTEDTAASKTAILAHNGRRYLAGCGTRPGYRRKPISPAGI